MEKCIYSNQDSYRVRTIMAVLGIQMSKRDIKKCFDIDEQQFEKLIEEANAISEMECVNALYSFNVKNLKEEEISFRPDDFVKPVYTFWCIETPTFESYCKILKRMRGIIHKPMIEYAYFSLKVGNLAEKEKNIGLASLIYKYTAIHSEELESKYRKRIMIRSVLNLSRLEFMRGVSPDETLALQRKAISMITQSNLTSEDALMMLYAGMGEHFGGTLEDGTELRDKGIRYMKQFNYENLEGEAVPLMCWHYYLKGDFRRTIAYYESYIIAIENRDRNSIISFTYPPIIFSYFFLGEYNQALVLSENMYNRAMQNGDHLAAALLYAIVGRAYVYLNDFDTGERVLNEAYEQGVKLDYGWAKYYAVWGKCLMAVRRSNFAECRELIILAREVASKDHFTPIIASPFVMEALHGIKESGLEEIPGLEYEEELDHYLNSDNEHMKGVAFRYRAENLKQKGEPLNQIIECLHRSITCLEVSGNIDELRKSYMEISWQYYYTGDENKTSTYVNRCWNYSTDDERSAFPKVLAKYVESTDLSEEFGMELEATWLELRNIVNEERLETRMLTSMCRLFGAESGVFAIIGRRGIELRLTQNLDKSDRYKPQMQKIEGIISMVASTGKTFLHCRERDETVRAESYSMSPVLSVAIPFKHDGAVNAVLYLQSYFEGRTIPESAQSAIELFGERMSETVYLAMNYDKLTDGAASVERSGEYGYNLKDNQRYCSSMDEEVIGIFHQIKKVACTAIPVLITGETGVGKEVFAREVFEQSSYRKTFIKVNCGAIPESLIESELFGYEKGSFTGATQRKKGYFEMAEGGTIFLDEIGELSMIAQVKLLRVLQEHELMRVGGTEAVKVDFRLIAATNKDLAKEVEAGTFRKDLYYRLNVVQLSIPPLRRRKMDIPNLTRFFIEKFCNELSKPICSVDSETFVQMLEYPWPGNVRELENTLQRAVLFAENGIIHLDFKYEMTAEQQGDTAVQTEETLMNEEQASKMDAAELMESSLIDEQTGQFYTLEEVERRYILRVIEHCGGKIGGKDGAADVLGMKRTTLLSRMEKLGIQNEKR